MLEQAQVYISNLIMNKKFLLVLFIIFIFILASIYVYKTYVSSKLDPDYVPNKEFTKTQNANDQSVDLYFFGVPWCPHSKKAMPVWSDLKSEYQNKKVNDYRINFIEIDCDQDPKTADEFKIEEYPTIKLIKNNQVIEYDAKPSRDTLKEFLNSML
jgi:thiol-disulfide isomerase/thioredoxin